MHHKPVILILTGDSGFGHRSAANSVEKALEVLHPHDVRTYIVNPILDQDSPFLLKSTELNYDRNVIEHPDLYRFSYEISDSRSASSLVETTLSLALAPQINELIHSLQPDGILSTNQLFSGPVGLVRKALNLRIPFYTVVTDLADVHSMWFNASPDHFFVASECVKTKAVDNGIPPENVTITGIPVDPALALPVSEKSELRKANGLDPFLPTLLLVGSKRVAGVPAYLEVLQQIEHPFQVVIIAGGNNELYEEVTQRNWNFPLHAENFVQNMPDWELCADVLITKAGGLILSEGLAAGLPIILIDYLPGQEEGNVAYVLENNAGIRAVTPEEFALLIDEWLSCDQSRLKQCGDHSKHLGHPESALVIAERLWQATENQTSKPQLRPSTMKKAYLWMKKQTPREDDLEASQITPK
ncbi:MAG: glycosyltransferase [Anaerolineaceae bacterium]